MSPTARTLKLLRDRGWTADVVERWLPGGFIRKDYLNVIDIISLDGEQTIGVQSCGEAFADHWRKITSEHAASACLWLASRTRRLLLIGWRPLKVKRGGVAKRYEPREAEIFLFDLEGAMRTPKKQVEELLKRGRDYPQIRAVAVARDDKALLAYVKELMGEDLI